MIFWFGVSKRIIQNGAFVFREGAFNPWNGMVKPKWLIGTVGGWDVVGYLRVNGPVNGRWEWIISWAKDGGMYGVQLTRMVSARVSRNLRLAVKRWSHAMYPYEFIICTGCFAPGIESGISCFFSRKKWVVQGFFIAFCPVLGKKAIPRYAYLRCGQPGQLRTSS